MLVYIVRHSVNKCPPCSNSLDSFNFAMSHQAHPTMSYILLVTRHCGTSLMCSVPVTWCLEKLSI